MSKLVFPLCFFLIKSTYLDSFFPAFVKVSSKFILLSKTPTRYAGTKSNKGNGIDSVFEENEASQMAGNVTNDGCAGADHGDGNHEIAPRAEFLERTARALRHGRHVDVLPRRHPLHRRILGRGR